MAQNIHSGQYIKKTSTKQSWNIEDYCVTSDGASLREQVSPKKKTKRHPEEAILKMKVTRNLQLK